MSEVLVEHPVLFIENLLKLGIGDKGRLLYLRNAMAKGENIHYSDKKFLKKMQYELDESRGLNSEKPYDNFELNYFRRKDNSSSETESQIFNQREIYSNEKKTNFKGNDSGIQKIQNLLTELKERDSKLMDNLELLLISHEVSSQLGIENSFDSFPNFLKNKNSKLFDLFKKNLKFKKF